MASFRSFCLIYMLKGSFAHWFAFEIPHRVINFIMANFCTVSFELSPSFFPYNMSPFIFLSVIFNLDCFWNQLKDKALCTPMRDFLAHIIWREIYIPNGAVFFFTVQIKVHEEPFPFCMLAFTATFKYINLLAVAPFHWYKNHHLHDSDVDWRQVATYESP